jgi:hypothetical protein
VVEGEGEEAGLAEEAEGVINSGGKRVVLEVEVGIRNMIIEERRSLAVATPAVRHPPLLLLIQLEEGMLLQRREQLIPSLVEDSGHRRPTIPPKGVVDPREIVVLAARHRYIHRPGPEMETCPNHRILMHGIVITVAVAVAVAGVEEGEWAEGGMGALNDIPHRRAVVWEMRTMMQVLVRQKARVNMMTMTISRRVVRKVVVVVEDMKVTRLRIIPTTRMREKMGTRLGGIILLVLVKCTINGACC